MDDHRSVRPGSRRYLLLPNNSYGLQEAVWLLIALVTPILVNLWVEQQFEASKIWLLRALVGVLVLLWLGGRMAGWRIRRLPPSILKLTLALSLVLLFSTLFSPNRYIAVFGSLDRANGVLTQATYLVLFLCVATQLDTQRSRRLLRTLILTAVPICLLALFQAAGWQPLPVLTDSRSPLTTTLGRANFTGAYLALLLPLTLTAAKSATDGMRRAGYGTVAALELVVIALTQARGAWIAAIVGVGVLSWLYLAPRWSRRVRWFSASVGVVGLALALAVILQRGIANGGSVAARWTIWQASLRLLWPRLWLGYGADTLELHFPSVYPPQLVYYQGRGVVVDRAHNWLLDGSLNYGVVVVLLFAGLVTLVLREGWKRLVSQSSAHALPPALQRLDVRWLAACMASICAHLVGNLFLFDVAATAVVFWLLLAIVSSANADDWTKSLRPQVPFWVRRSVMVISSLLLAWGVWQGSVQPLLADVHAWRGTRALGQGNALAALAEYAEAIQRQPRRAEYHVAWALTAAQLGSFEPAYEAMHEAIALRPADPVLYTHLAATYVAGAGALPDRLGLAYAAYERAIALAPTIALTYQQHADLALRSGDGATALVQAQHAVGLDATDGIAFGILGWAQLQAGDLAAAQDAFEQAVVWEPESADFHLGLATVYLQQGKTVGAEQAIRRSLSCDPTYAPTLALQAQLGNE